MAVAINLWKQDTFSQQSVWTWISKPCNPYSGHWWRWCGLLREQLITKISAEKTASGKLLHMFHGLGSPHVAGGSFRFSSSVGSPALNSESQCLASLHPCPHFCIPCSQSLLCLLEQYKSSKKKTVRDLENSFINPPSLSHLNGHIWTFLVVLDCGWIAWTN